MEKKAMFSLARNFIFAYYQDMDIDVLMSIFDINICWNSGHCPNILRGRANVKEELLNIFRERSYFFNIDNVDFYETMINQKLSRVSYKITVTIDYNLVSKLQVLMGTLTLKKDSKGEILIYEVHMPIFESEKQFIYHIIEETKIKENYNFEQIQYENALNLKQAKDDLEILTNNVPGGIFRCLDNAELTILYMSEGFLEMFGYTKEEIATRFHNSFRAMIDPRDRESTAKEVEYQLSLGKAKQIEYRVLHKDGHSIWVLDKGQLVEDKISGCLSFYCIMIDITLEKKVQQELRLTLERYDIIMNQSNDIIFEWDIIKDQLKYSQGLESIFRRKIPKTNISKFLHSEILYQNDIEKTKQIIAKIKNGESYIEEELRLYNQKYNYKWWRLRLTVQYNTANKPIRAIGILIDINQEKKKSQYLLDKAQQDALTGIYNKVTVQTYIKNYLWSLQTDELCAMFIIDIDNFKDINDRMGHLVGDAILSDIARRMKKVFKTTDLIGRIGGDEFIAFFKNIDNINSVEHYAIKMINEMYEIQSSHSLLIPISCSIGISLVPRDGNDFTSLFQKADQALYQAKKDGKNQYAIYDQHVVTGYFTNNKGRSIINETIDSNSKILNKKLSEYVFSVLYSAQEIKVAISTILKIVGMQYDVSRVYIFENIENDQYCCNTFEWCNEGIEPQIEFLKRISYEKDLGGHYEDNFNEMGIFYCTDITALPKEQYEILKPQGIKSMLQCAIMSNGVFKGYVGFDECHQNRYWTQEQINTLVFISEILSIFLLKSRAEMVLEQETESLLRILNSQNNWIYVINPRNYELLFMNKKISQFFPKTEIGMKCFKQFLHKEMPCSFCPLQHFNIDLENHSFEVYNEYFNTWANMDVSRILWKGQDGIMLSGHDITTYKKS